MAKIINSTDKGAAISASENDTNLSTLAGINVADATNSRTIDVDDQGATIEFTFAGAVAVTLSDIADIYGAGTLHTDDFTITMIATGASTVVTITPDGTDSINTGAATIVLTTDEYVVLQTDSTGAIWNIINSSGITSVIRDKNSNESIVIVTSTNAINALGVTNSATTDPIILAPLGDDPDIQLNLSPKGNDSVFLRAPGAGNSIVSSNTGNSIITSDAGGISIDAVAGGVTIDAGSGDVDIVSSGDTTIDAVVSDSVTAETTNGDLTLAGNGTGKVLVDGLYTKVLDIGDWNMDTTPSLNVPHSIADFTKVRNITVLIRNDADTAYSDFHSWEATQTTATTLAINATNVVMFRGTSGLFDSADYNSTSYNRGWITIQYTS